MHYPSGFGTVSGTPGLDTQWLSSLIERIKPWEVGGSLSVGGAGDQRP